MKWKYCWITGIIIAVVLEIFYLSATFYLSRKFAEFESPGILSMFVFPPSLPEILAVLTLGFLIGFIIGILINLGIFIISKVRQN